MLSMLAEDKAGPKPKGPKGKAAPARSMLSCEDDMEIEEPENGKFCLANTTHRKYAPCELIASGCCQWSLTDG